jgi:hypothetical protein
MTTLYESQVAISGWVRAPEGIAEALVVEDASDPNAAPGDANRRLESLIRSDESLDASGRLEIYANAYFSRIHGVLRADYPALIAMTGEAAFNDLVTSYLLVEPSRSPSLRYVGLRLADFISNHQAMAGVRKRWPEAADLAAFEWARIDVFDATDGPVLTREFVAELAPAQFAELFLCLGTWVRLRVFEHPVLRLWRAGASNEASGFEGESGPAHVLIWRHNERVFHRSLDPIEEAALAMLSLGSRFDGLCEWAAGEIGDEQAPTQAAAWLEQWLADGLLVVV